MTADTSKTRAGAGARADAAPLARPAAEGADGDPGANAGHVGACGSPECARECGYPSPLSAEGCALVGWRTANTGPILPVVDPIVAAVQADLGARSARGQAKYGTTLARGDLTHRDWQQHAYEEALDMALYLRRAMEDGR